MTSPSKKITDAGVAALPVHDGRVELLEEIMTTPVLDRIKDRPDPDRSRGGRWAVVVAAAASVAVVASAPLWLDLGKDGGTAGRDTQVATGVEPPAAGPTGDRAVLDSAGWTVDHANDDPENGGEISYRAGEREVQLTWYRAEYYDSYVEDRQHIEHPAVDPGTPVTVAGKPALMWPYSATDHAAIRAVEKDFFIEVRASGMDEAAFLELLTHVRMVDKAGFEAALPESFVSDAERRDAITGMVAGLGALPPGFDPASISSSEPDRYHLGADVTAAVSCAWVKEYAAATAAGAEDRVAAARQAMQASRTWPILLEMDERGDWPESIWQIADDMAAGDTAELIHERTGDLCLADNGPQ